MSEQEHPVTVAVTRSDGRVEQVRVGTAIRVGDGFSLQLGELTLGRAVESRGMTSAGPRPAAGSGGAPGEISIFPPYGRSKGAPIRGASEGDLEFYANGAKRSLNDPSKERWHDRDRALLATIEAELARQRGGGAMEEEPAARGGFSSGGALGDEPPPHGDDDLPF